MYVMHAEHMSLIVHFDTSISSFADLMGNFGCHGISFTLN